MTTKTKVERPNLNVELLDQIMEAVEKANTEGRWNQENWIYAANADDTGLVKAEEVTIKGEKLLVLPVTCNTGFCFAGWAVFLQHPEALWTQNQMVVGTEEDLAWAEENGLTKNNYYGLLNAPERRGDGLIIADPGAVAARLIGLSRADAEDLFDGDNSLEGLRLRVAQIKNGEPVTRGGEAPGEWGYDEED